MAVKSVAFLALLLFATILVGFNMENASALLPECIPADHYYMTCPSTGSEHLPPPCFCSQAGPGCKIFSSDDGSQFCKPT